MKPKYLFALFFIVVIAFTSCNKEKLFEQPTVEVTSFSLTELPGEYTNLMVDIVVTNNDKREAYVTDISYVVTIEGFDSEPGTATIDQTIDKDPITLSLPLTLKTKDAIQLLTKINEGEELNYVVSGNFNITDPLSMELPLDVQGKASVEVGYEDFFTQPEITINDMTTSYTTEGVPVTNYTFNMDVNTTVKNKEAHSATIDEVEYVVTIEGVQSQTHFYSDSYSSDLSIAANGSVDLDLPVTVNLTSEKAESWISDLSDGTANYTVEGTIHVTEIDGETVDFMLPLYQSGNLPVTNLFKQPIVTVTAYALNDISGDSTEILVDITLKNNDSKGAFITDVNYIVEIEGFQSGLMHYNLDMNISGNQEVELSLPVKFLTIDAVQMLDLVDQGQSLDYHVIGVFHVDDPVLNLLDLPIDITGTASVETGYEDFFEQPEITVQDIEYTYSTSGFPVPTSYTFNLQVNCTVENKDTRSATIDEVEYYAIVEGVTSSTHLYSDTYSSDIVIAGGETIDLTLPVTLTMSATEGATFASRLADGSASYEIIGTFHVTIVDGGAVNISLPLYDNGSVPVSMVTK